MLCNLWCPNSYGHQLDTSGTLAADVALTMTHTQAEVLWLMAAKHKWRVENDVAGARGILAEAFQVCLCTVWVWVRVYEGGCRSAWHTRHSRHSGMTLQLQASWFSSSSSSLRALTPHPAVCKDGQVGSVACFASLPGVCCVDCGLLQRCVAAGWCLHQGYDKHKRPRGPTPHPVLTPRLHAPTFQLHAYMW